MGDAQAGRRAAQAMLDERAPDPLALGSEFDQRQRGGDQQFRFIFLQDENIAHLVHGARQGQARVGTGVARLLHAQPEERAVVVDDRACFEGVLLLALERHPVGRVVGEQLQPSLVLLCVEQARLVVEKLLNVHSCNPARRETAPG